LVKRFLRVSEIIIITLRNSGFASRNQPDKLTFNLNMHNKKQSARFIIANYRITRFLIPPCIDQFKKGIKNASVACSKVIPSCLLGLAAALRAFQTKVTPFLSKRISMRVILSNVLTLSIPSHSKGVSGVKRIQKCQYKYYSFSLLPTYRAKFKISLGLWLNAG